MVSIHAPVKARQSASWGNHHVPCFDPRAREGATRPCCPTASRHSCFDPRAREGATASFAANFPGIASFDPRAREGATRDE